MAEQKEYPGSYESSELKNMKKDDKITTSEIDKFLGLSDWKGNKYVRDYGNKNKISIENINLNDISDVNAVKAALKDKHGDNYEKIFLELQAMKDEINQLPFEKEKEKEILKSLLQTELSEIKQELSTDKNKVEKTQNQEIKSIVINVFQIPENINMDKVNPIGMMNALINVIGRNQNKSNKFPVSNYDTWKEYGYVADGIFDVYEMNALNAIMSHLKGKPELIDKLSQIYQDIASTDNTGNIKLSVTEISNALYTVKGTRITGLTDKVVDISDREKISNFFEFIADVGGEIGKVEVHNKEKTGFWNYIGKMFGNKITKEQSEFIGEAQLAALLTKLFTNITEFNNWCKNTLDMQDADLIKDFKTASTADLNKFKSKFWEQYKLKNVSIGAGSVLTGKDKQYMQASIENEITIEQSITQVVNAIKGEISKQGNAKIDELLGNGTIDEAKANDLRKQFNTETIGQQLINWLKDGWNFSFLFGSINVDPTTKELRSDLVDFLKNLKIENYEGLLAFTISKEIYKSPKWGNISAGLANLVIPYVSYSNTFKFPFTDSGKYTVVPFAATTGVVSTVGMELNFNDKINGYNTLERQYQDLFKNIKFDDKNNNKLIFPEYTGEITKLFKDKVAYEAFIHDFSQRYDGYKHVDPNNLDYNKKVFDNLTNGYLKYNKTEYYKRHEGASIAGINGGMIFVPGLGVPFVGVQIQTMNVSYKEAKRNLLDEKFASKEGKLQGLGFDRTEIKREGKQVSVYKYNGNKEIFFKLDNDLEIEKDSNSKIKYIANFKNVKLEDFDSTGTAIAGGDRIFINGATDTNNDNNASLNNNQIKNGLKVEGGKILTTFDFKGGSVNIAESKDKSKLTPTMEKFKSPEIRTKFANIQNEYMNFMNGKGGNIDTIWDNAKKITSEFKAKLDEIESTNKHNVNLTDIKRDMLGYVIGLTSGAQAVRDIVLTKKSKNSLKIIESTWNSPRINKSFDENLQAYLGISTAKLDSIRKLYDYNNKLNTIQSSNYEANTTLVKDSIGFVNFNQTLQGKNTFKGIMPVTGEFKLAGKMLFPIEDNNIKEGLIKKIPSYILENIKKSIGEDKITTADIINGLLEIKKDKDGYVDIGNGVQIQSNCKLMYGRWGDGCLNDTYVLQDLFKGIKIKKQGQETPIQVVGAGEGTYSQGLKVQTYEAVLTQRTYNISTLVESIRGSKEPEKKQEKKPDEPTKPCDGNASIKVEEGTGAKEDMN